MCVRCIVKVFTKAYAKPSNRSLKTQQNWVVAQLPYLGRQVHDCIAQSCPMLILCAQAPMQASLAWLGAPQLHCCTPRYTRHTSAAPIRAQSFCRVVSDGINSQALSKSVKASLSLRSSDNAEPRLANTLASWAGLPTPASPSRI